MATISFYSDGLQVIGGSGLGYYGNSFGASVAVGAYAQTVYMTTPDGSVQGAQVNSVRFANAGSGYVEAASVATGLRFIPNRDATLNVRFTHDVAVFTQNAQFRVYDRITTTNSASGVTTKCAELRHPSINQDPTGSGDLSWTTFNAGVSGTVLNLTPGPGVSGIGANGVGIYHGVHDWYLAISPSPDSIGSKAQFGGHFQVEYL